MRPCLDSLTALELRRCSCGAGRVDGMAGVVRGGLVWQERTLLGIEEGVTELNLSEKKVDPSQAKILAAELKASRAVAMVKRVVLSNNFLFGSYDHQTLYQLLILNPSMPHRQHQLASLS